LFLLFLFFPSDSWGYLTQEQHSGVQGDQ